MEISQPDRDFINLNMINFETIGHGYVRNLGTAADRYEEIYKKYLDPQFVLQKWCSDCVFNMLKRLRHWWYINNTVVIEVPDPVATAEETGIEVHPVKANQRRRSK